MEKFTSLHKRHQPNSDEILHRYSMHINSFVTIKFPFLWFNLFYFFRIRNHLNIYFVVCVKFLRRNQWDEKCAIRFSKLYTHKCNFRANCCEWQQQQPKKKNCILWWVYCYDKLRREYDIHGKYTNLLYKPEIFLFECVFVEIDEFADAVANNGYQFYIWQIIANRIQIF